MKKSLIKKIKLFSTSFIITSPIIFVASCNQKTDNISEQETEINFKEGENFVYKKFYSWSYYKSEDFEKFNISIKNLNQKIKEILDFINTLKAENKNDLEIFKELITQNYIITSNTAYFLDQENKITIKFESKNTEKVKALAWKINLQVKHINHYDDKGTLKIIIYFKN
ncbi:hypothetical protein [Mycoplasma sp. 5370]